MVKRKRSTKTATSTFGTSGRVSHDSSRFYNSRLYAGRQVKSERKTRTTAMLENAVPAGVLDRVLCKSSESMDELPENCVHLMITSPPYNVSKEYDENLTLDEYRDLLRRVMRETYRVLVHGGRACINVANVGRKPYIPLNAYIARDMIELGFVMRGEIIWNKSSSVGPSTAWGSWKSASNPTLRDVHEYILVFSKADFSRNGVQRKSTITREEFLEYTKSIWTFPAESARRVGHPAPFPVELPRRLIQLFSFADDVVLDPFAGSGTTCVAARACGRHFIGYEKQPAYVRLAEQRLSNMEKR
ncbi:MAG TPA: site-specific DNA-methyltransferase [Bacteroidota bacterium]|nr:site-specific DNA-methyltransferase [Bacteroidota bacterium]